MATPEQPWWERPGPAPAEPDYDPEREHLRAELARSWRARLDEHQQRRTRSIPVDSHQPPAAA